MSKTPKDNDLVGILNAQEEVINQLEFIVSSQKFSANGAGVIGPQGPQGLTGSTGAAGTITVGSVTTGEAGTSVSITNSGTASAAVLDFTIPRGDKGDKGDQGDQGIQGIQGVPGVQGTSGNDLISARVIYLS